MKPQEASYRLPLPDNGCRSYRGLFPLHTRYTSTQLAFAAAYLKTHREVRLVTLMLGANDGFLLEAACASNPSNTTAALVADCIEAGAPAFLNPRWQGTSKPSSPICAPPDIPG